MTVGSAGTVSTAGAAAPTAATARSDVADGWAAWPEPVPAKTGTASAAAATMASRRRISREGNGLFTLSFFRESCATAGRTSLNVPVVEATSRYVSLVWIGEGRRRRWAARARRRTAQRQISGCVREGRGRVSRSRHQGAAARRQTSQAGVTRARAAEMDNPGGCATPHAADGSARRQGRRAVCRTAKTRVEEGNRDICVSPSAAEMLLQLMKGWLPDRSERCAPVVRASSPTFGGTLSMRTVIVNGIVRSPIARTCVPPCRPAMWC